MIVILATEQFHKGETNIESPNVECLVARCTADFLEIVVFQQNSATLDPGTSPLNLT